MGSNDRIPVLRLAIVTDTGHPVYDHDFHPTAAGRRTTTVRPEARRPRTTCSLDGRLAGA